MRDLQIPEKARTSAYDSEQFIDLPCGDIFNGVMPKIRLARLAELAPDSVTAVGFADETVRVCSARLALAYVVTEGRELIEEPPPPVLPEPPAEKESVAEKGEESPKEAGKDVIAGGKMEKDILEKQDPKMSPPEKKPAEAARTSPEDGKSVASTAGFVPARPTIVSAPKPAEPLPAANKAETDKPTDAKPASAKSVAASPVESKPAITPLPPAAPEGKTLAAAPSAEPSAGTPARPPVVPPPADPGKTTLPSPEAKSDQASAAAAVPEGTKDPATVPVPPEPAGAGKPSGEKAESEEKTVLPPKRPFSLFPMFRRKEAADDKLPATVPRNRIELPAPKRPSTPVTDQPPAPKEETKAIEAELVESKPTGPRPTLPKPRFEPRAAAPEAAVKPVVPASEEPSVRPPAARSPEPAASPTKESVAPPPAPPEPSRVGAPIPPLAVEITKGTPGDAPSPGEKPPAATAPPREATVPPQPSAPDPGPSAQPAKPEAKTPPVDAGPPAEPEKKASPESPAPTAAPDAQLVPTEHVAGKDAPPEIPDQDSLQAIFHTEEFLSVDRVMELCGKLPGIHSCILSHGAGVIASHNTPDSVDIVSLSAHALEMIKAMRTSSAKMGIGAVPAVTVHSEKGPITFFHQDDLCLLVMHKDRGFVPGVREKLQAVVDELTKAKLPVRLGDRPPIRVLRE